MAVPNSPELRRVLALPRRAEIVVPSGYFEDWLQVRPGLPLRSVQAQALYELEQLGGLLGPIGVGHGKTLIALLAGAVMGVERTVLLVPPALKAQVLERDYAYYAKYWRLPALGSALHVVAYSDLSSAKHGDVLERLRPDLIVCDEAHSISAPTSARTKRFRRYFKARAAAGRPCRLVALSGTIISKSIKEVAPLANLALGAGSPYPRDYATLESWSWAVDDVPLQCPPGALRALGPGPAADALGAWVRNTPGVVTAPPAFSSDASLVLRERALSVPKPVLDALATLKRTWVTPDGASVADAAEYSRYARQLASGLYLRWTWPRGESLAVREEWFEARREWAREVRAYLTKRAGPGRDSEGLLEKAAASGAWRSDTYARWARAKHTAKPKQADPYWVSDFMVEDALAWASKNRGAVWVQYPEFGAALAARGLRFFGAGESEALLRETGERSYALSIPAFFHGQNLQYFDSALVTHTSGNGKKWEQLLGRHHRQGQRSDTVTFDVYRHCEAVRESFDAALRNADEVQRPLQGPQRILAASKLWSPSG